MSRYGDENKVLLVEPALANEVQTGIVVSEDDGKLVAERMSKLSAAAVDRRRSKTSFGKRIGQRTDTTMVNRQMGFEFPDALQVTYRSGS